MEIALHRALTHLGLEHSHNPFDNRYCGKFGKGVDAIVSTSRGNIEFECKNPNGKHSLSRAWLKKEVVDRFGYKPFKRLLIISLLNGFVGCERWLRVNNSTDVIELGYQVGWHNIKFAIRDLVKLLYRLKVKYGKLVGKPLKTVATNLLQFNNAVRVVYDIEGFVVGLGGWGVTFNETERSPNAVT